MEGRARLKRRLGLFEVALSGLSIILGAGIYVLLGKASDLAGNAVWLSFVLSAAVALLTGLSYAELASLFPKASAEYEYAKRAFGETVAFTIGWMVILAGIVGSSVVALGFGGYFHSLTGIHPVLSACALIVLLSLLAFCGIKESVWFAIIATLAVSTGLLFVAGISIPHLGNIDYLHMPRGFTGVLEASALIFFAYIGFEQIVKLAEETRHPERTIPRALITAVAISAAFYVVVGIGAVSLMSWERLGESEAPLADAAFSVFGRGGSAFVILTALFATGNAVLLTSVTTSRIVYGMAQSGALPWVAGKLHPDTGTPWVAILCTSAGSLLFALVNEISLVARITNFILFVTFIAVNGVVVHLRFKKPQTHRPFRVPLSLGRVPVLPVLSMLFCGFMLYQFSVWILLLGSTLIGVGATFSFVRRFARRRSRRKLTVIGRVMQFN